MNKTTKSHVTRDARTIGKLIQGAINQGKTLTEIAIQAGLSVPTVSRIFEATEGNVHPRTARALLTALGSGEGRKERLSAKEKQRIMKVVLGVLRRELERV